MMKSSSLLIAAIATVAFSAAAPGRIDAQQHQHPEQRDTASAPGWRLQTMGQVFPIITAGEPFDRDAALSDRESYLTQPAVMFSLFSPSSRFVLRTTLNFEAVTQEDGEYTFGGWGEGFIDKRHPHTIVHELMLSTNIWNVADGALSLSLGKGFVPYGTEDPMGRPAVKFPTNHHLSQILERWTVNAAYVNATGWTLEGGLFGGTEPTDAYDFSNIESFGDSWAVRVGKRFVEDNGAAPWEATASLARVVERHGESEEGIRLYNVGLRHEQQLSFGKVYGLFEASLSDPDDEPGFYAVLAEAQLTRGKHQPYARFEFATRPEFHREGAAGTPGFFRYAHDTHSDGASRWAITTIGYGYNLTSGTTSTRPFFEVQHNKVGHERGNVKPRALFGRSGFWSVTAGFRIFFNGGPMRMGTYGVLDPMTPIPGASKAPQGHHHAH